MRIGVLRTFRLATVLACLGWLGYGFAQQTQIAAAQLKALRDRADQGDAQAQFRLARIYDEGDGVRQDLTEALRWYRKSAEQGLSIAQVRLGAIYYNGDGVPQDASEGVRWWLEAAGRGSNLAKFNLGGAYYQGVGVRQDYVQAYMWMDLAASHAARAGDKALAGLAGRSRETLAGKMTPAQVSEAQRQAQEWKPKTE